MKPLINKLAHACGLYTANDVEHIEKHWRDRLDKVTTAGIRLVAGAGAGGSTASGGAGSGGSGGHGHGPIPGKRGPWDFYNQPATVIMTGGASPSPTKSSQNPTAPTGQRMSAAERRELAAEAARWCEQQRIETSPENIIFYLDDRRMISAPTPGTAEKEEKTKPTKCHQCINYGWGMPQCRECNPGNNWKYFQKDL